MLTKKEREYWMRQGYQAGFRDGIRIEHGDTALGMPVVPSDERDPYPYTLRKGAPRGKSPKRKLSAWNKYVKANSKKPRFRYRNGKLNLKKMAIAFRKTPQGKKKRR